MLAVPAERPFTIPEVAPTDAMVGALLVQEPPETVLPSVIDELTHTEEAPVIVPAFGNGLIVIFFVTLAVPQLFVTVYEIVAVPAANPFTSPDVPIEAIVGALLVHEPPATALLKLRTDPTHTVDAPLMAPAFGNGLTVTTVVVVPAVTV
jgi:uncharacterized MnhB-related membrane protein